MAYTITEVFRLADGGLTTILNFRPGVVQVSRQRREANQEATVCESGRQVVSSFSDNIVESVDLTFVDLQSGNETVDGFTVNGFSALRTFVESTASYRENAVAINRQGVIGTTFEYGYYLDQSDLTSVIEYQDDSGNNVYSCKLALRRVVT